MLQIKKFTLIGFFIALGISIAQTALAQNAVNDAPEIKPLKQYDIEIILFKNINVPKGSEKILPVQAPTLDETFISFANQDDITASAEQGFILPEENEYRLLDIVDRISQSSRYQLVKHMAWRQPGLAKENALAVQIRAGKLFGNDYSSIDNPVKPLLSTEDLEAQQLEMTNPQVADTTQAIPLELITEEPKLVWYELEGKITITLARYLHAYVDLVIRTPSENSLEINESAITVDDTQALEVLSFASATLNNFAFKEHRRMRSRKLHYLDHPELGILILITPYEAPENIEFIDNDLNLGLNG